MIEICVGTGHELLARLGQQKAHGVKLVNFELEALISARTIRIRSARIHLIIH